MLTLSGLYLYRILAHDLKSEERNFLDDQMVFFREMIHMRPSEFVEVKEKIDLENSTLNQPTYFVRILDENKAVLIQSKGKISAWEIFPDLNYSQNSQMKWTKAGSSEHR